ncbi:cyclic nucleotide-binding domain-containing protein [Maribacter confluentis]|uniref:Cyclic nucleotide-binding domain-containing protein n=1 Tax=Maribacter confluentis TaxID=1656093 RepID=A0ABT8RQK6_9FLAO|nr:cyclic nucleotide-binding domain-containing protein [Maribacter confluentis]MDO1513188.1 cyclic nucleotide-binding domain-containing protein [Maribacter confluentis]
MEHQTRLLKQEINTQKLQEYFPNGQIKTYSKGYAISYIHKKVSTFRWLLEGSVNYYISLENPESDILVCQNSEPFSTIGLNGFNTPKRFTYKAIVASTQATFFEIPFKELKAYLQKGHQNILLKNIGSKLYHVLRTALLKQTELLNPVRFQPFVEDRQFFISPVAEQEAIVSLMRRSPFLDYFEERNLMALAALAERREYEPDEVLYVQDGSSNGLFILIHGEVTIKRIENTIEIKQRSIKNSGFVFGWSCLLKEKDICSAITNTKTSAYFIPEGDLMKLFQQDDIFEGQFYQRLLWLIGNQLNAAFVRYVGLLGKHNLQAVYQLIKNNKSRLLLSSPLHQVPHLLKSNTTKQLAYGALAKLVKSGTSLERHIASLSLELLGEDQKEYEFLSGLQEIYKSVAEKNSKDVKQNRKSCAELTIKVFNNVPHIIEGWENLPDNTGNIFIYNHLVNDAHYTLNNNFQITLDSHFLSAMVLYKKYGEPGIRTVRIGKGQEYGHQNYYDNLGYINVYTKESEQPSTDKKEEARSIFYREATKHLEQGYNLIISPEGTSYRTEESPGPFKMGAFKLALHTEPEPYIVPVVMVNFDHRLGKSLYYCAIQKPFLLSEKVASKSNQDLYAFLQKYQDEYSSYVQTAIERADELNVSNSGSDNLEEPPAIWCNEIKRLKRRIGKLETQENLIAFYGSSSVRLWVNMQRDLSPFNVVNLGFGGSTFAWCIHYFDEIFKEAHPSKIVLYAGENDLNDGKTPQEVLSGCMELVTMIYDKYPGVELALISLKPSVEREYLIPLIMETNLMLSKYIITELNAQYINVFAQMITTDNRPIPELYLSDGLHLNKQGYALWSTAIKKALQAADSLELENQF